MKNTQVVYMICAGIALSTLSGCQPLTYTDQPQTYAYPTAPAQIVEVTNNNNNSNTVSSPPPPPPPAPAPATVVVVPSHSVATKAEKAVVAKKVEQNRANQKATTNAAQ